MVSKTVGVGLIPTIPAIKLNMCKKTIFVDTNILCKCCEINEMLKHFHNLSKENILVTTDIFLNEFKQYILCKAKKSINDFEKIKSIFSHIIDCKKIYKKMKDEINYRDYILTLPHKRNINKKSFTNNHNDTLSWLSIIDYCCNKNETTNYEFWSNDTDFYLSKEYLANEFLSNTQKRIDFKTFYPIKIFEVEYKNNMQFENLRSWFLSFTEIINENIKNNYAPIIEIVETLIKDKNIVDQHPIKTIFNLIKHETIKKQFYIDINKWFIDFYKKNFKWSFSKKIKVKKREAKISKKWNKWYCKKIFFLIQIK